MVNIWPIFGRLLGGVCPLCRTPGDGLCAACHAALPFNTRACPVCALPLPDGAAVDTRCAECQTRSPAFDRVVAPLRYVAPVDDLVSGFKYHHRLHLGRPLAEILAARLAGQAIGPGLLLPIPSTPHRLAERGFNQATELARWLSRLLGLPLATDRLVRTDNTGPQRGATRRQRRRNVRGIFACRGGLPSHVAVVDDVVTTGATAEEASRVLRQAGVKRIEVWAAARTPRAQDL